MHLHLYGVYSLRVLVFVRGVKGEMVVKLEWGSRNEAEKQKCSLYQVCVSSDTRYYYIPYNIRRGQCTLNYLLHIYSI